MATVLPPLSAEELDACFAPPAPFGSPDPTLRSPLVFDDGRPVRDAAEWAERRQEILAYWHGALGAWPPLLDAPEIEIVDTVACEGYQRHRVQ